MENQINVGGKNIQHTEQNPIHQPVQVSEKPKFNYWMVSTILLLIILIMGGAWFFLNTQNKCSLSQPSETSGQTKGLVVIGVLRTSGLSEEEKQKLSLTTDYQITDFKIPQEEQAGGYYLLSNMVNDELLGRCVRVAGMVPSEWKSKDNSDSYNRLALNVTNIEKIDNSSCNPYSQTFPIADDTQEKLTLQGTVVRGKRPSPDIGYDYQLKLTEPFIDKFSSAGSLQKVSIVDIMPSSDNIWNVLEYNINKEINVEGYMVWGYAESRFLTVTSVSASTGGK